MGGRISSEKEGKEDEDEEGETGMRRKKKKKKKKKRVTLVMDDDPSLEKEVGDDLSISLISSQGKSNQREEK
jgi:hypothetical protein